MKDKSVSGLSIISVIFFTIWGYWNLFYYPSLGQMWSFAGGIVVVIANSIWTYLLLKYARYDQLPRFLWGISDKIKANKW